MRTGWIVWIMAAILWGTGCRSAYHPGQNLLQTTASDQFHRRIQEARRAEHSAEAARTTVRDRFTQRPRSPALAADLDRLETAARELKRRVAAAQDAAGRCSGPAPPQSEAEIRRLEQRAAELLDEVEAWRRQET